MHSCHLKYPPSWFFYVSVCVHACVHIHVCTWIYVHICIHKVALLRYVIHIPYNSFIYSVHSHGFIFTKLCNHHKKRLLIILVVNPYSLPPPTLGNYQSALYIYGFAYYGHFMKVESCNMWLSMTVFFHSA